MSFFLARKSRCGYSLLRGCSGFFVSGFGGFFPDEALLCCRTWGRRWERRGVIPMLPIIILLTELIRLAREVIGLLRDIFKDKKKKR